MCGNADELRAAIAEHEPDVVVTDIRMPPDLSDDGIRVARDLRTTHPGTGVVEPDYHRRARAVPLSYGNGLVVDQLAARSGLRPGGRHASRGARPRLAVKIGLTRG